jgi:hypothetical protein
MEATKVLRILIICEGVYYAVTGIWPLVSMSTFERVTGSKTDDWLVQTVGSLALLIGCSLLFGLRRSAVSAETRFLAIGGAVVFALVDVVFTLGGRISKIYLADAVIQAGFVTGLLLASRSERRSMPSANSGSS